MELLLAIVIFYIIFKCLGLLLLLLAMPFIAVIGFFLAIGLTIFLFFGAVALGILKLLLLPFLLILLIPLALFT